MTFPALGAVSYGYRAVTGAGERVSDPLLSSFGDEACMHPQKLPRVVRLLLLDRYLARLGGLVEGRFLFPLDEIPKGLPVLRQELVSLANVVTPLAIDRIGAEASRGPWEHVLQHGLLPGFLVWRIVVTAQSALQMVRGFDARALHWDEGQMMRGMASFHSEQRRFRFWLALFELLYVAESSLPWGLGEVAEDPPWWKDL